MNFSKAIRLHLDYSDSQTKLSDLNILQTPEGMFLFRDPNDLRPAFLIEGVGEDYLMGVLFFNEESEADDAIRNHIDDDVKIEKVKEDNKKPFLVVSVKSKQLPRQVNGYDDYVFIKRNDSKQLIYKDPPEIGNYFAIKASKGAQLSVDKTYFYYMLKRFDSMLRRYYLGSTVGGIREDDVYDFIYKAMNKAYQMRKESKIKKDRKTFFNKISRKIKLANSNFIKNAGAAKKECEANQGDGLATCCALAEMKIPLLNVRKKVVNEMSFFMSEIISPIFSSLNFNQDFLRVINSFGDKSKADELFTYACNNKNKKVNEEELVEKMVKFTSSKDKVLLSFEKMREEITSYLQAKVDKYSWAIDKACRSAVEFNRNNILTVTQAVFELSEELNVPDVVAEDGDRRKELKEISEKVKESDVYSDALGGDSFGVF